MTFRYRYILPYSTVFIHETKNGHTWVPDYFEEIEVDHPINSPALELISNDDDAPQEPETVEPPKTVEAIENNDAVSGETEES